MNKMEDFFPLLAELEPVTSLTDLLVAYSGFYFYFLIKKESIIENPISGWKYFFFFMGLSTLFGTFSHILENNGYQKVYFFLWNIMQLLAGFAMYFAQKAAIIEINNKTSKWLFQLFSNFQFMIFIPSVLYFQDFRVVAFNSLLVIIQMLLIFFPRNHPLKYSYSKIWWGFVISVFTVIIHQQKIGFSRWFNHKDVSHLMMVLSLWMIFKGVKWRLHKVENFVMA